MFPIELYLENRRAKINGWNERADKWVNEFNDNYGSYGYDRDTYARRHPEDPRPYTSTKTILAIVLPILGGLIGAGLLILAIVNQPPHKVDPNNPNDCSTLVHKGDKVGVTAGAFLGSEGIIIDQRSDCSVDLTLTKSTNSFDDCVKQNYDNCGGTINVGGTLNVDTDQNITKL